VIIVSAIAARLAAWLVRKFAPEAKGSGIPDVEVAIQEATNTSKAGAGEAVIEASALFQS
jgi:H+/Cl- antiporter ClcA